MTRRIFCKVLLVVVAIFGLLVLSSVLSAQGNRDWALEHVKEVQERNTDRLMAIDGVVGTAIGLNPNARLSVAVLLERPGVGGIPQELDGVPVHPVVTGEIYALPKDNNPGQGKGGGKGGGKKEKIDPTARFDRPVPIGVSTGHPAITAGTIGCRVTKNGKVYALSNNHVYADENKASKGDNVLQPGAYDGGVDPVDAIGTLSDFEPIKFDGSDNTIDAAIALCEGTLGNSTPSDGYEAPKSETVEAIVGLSVQKYGRTTGLTKGTISMVNAIADVTYDTGKARFVGQFVIGPDPSFSSGGDSGSLIVVAGGKGKRRNPDDRKAVGLLFAGSSLYTIANPIDAVLDAFNVIIDGE